MACNIKDDREVQKAFWNEAKGQLASGIEPEEVIRNIAKKYKIGSDAVGGILSKSRQLFQLTNEAWAKQAKLSEMKSAAKQAVSEADINPFVKGLRKAYEAPRRLLTLGHGGVIPFTHAKNSLYIPGEAGIFKDTVARAYSYMTPEGGSARWRADMATMRSDPKFNFWARNGLDIKLQSKPVGMGMTRWTRQSFDALKPMRIELAKMYWEKLSPDMRSAEAAQDIAKRINHATGVVKTPPVVSKIAGATMFAPKLRFAKYATVADAFSSKLGAARFAKVAAVNLGMLSTNYMVNKYMFGVSDSDNVNWDKPSRADWMRMKVAGMTIPMAPMFETARLPIAAGAVMLNPNEDNKAKVLTKEIASALHPALSAGYGVATGTDLATGHALPFKGVSQYMYGDHRDERKVFGKWRPNKYAQQISPGEYGAGFLPIPAQPIVKNLVKEGISPSLAQAFVEAILSGGAGTHAYPDVPYKH